MKAARKDAMDRREFLRTATASAAGITVLASGTATSYAANDRFEVGIIGCGGRGIWIGDLFQKHANAKVVAVHDYFKDRVDLAGKQLDVPEDRRYVGLEGYKDLVASDLDAVAVESPPYFHPEQTVVALEAGKHVYLAKPIAVDVPGCLAIMEAAKAHAGKLSVLVDFQTRNNELFREAARRIHEGAIGTPVYAQAYYHCDRLGKRSDQGGEIGRLRNWCFDIALSGDIIVEQNIHVLDVANWFLGAHPVEARGCGARRGRTDIGDCWDHFIAQYRYPNDVLLSFSSQQFAPGCDDLCTRVFGTEGAADAHYGGNVSIQSRKDHWPGGETNRIYQEGAVNNMKDFRAGIESGNLINNAEDGGTSTLTAILGRMAAYTGEAVTWEQMLAAGEALDPKLDLPEDGPYTKAWLRQG
ncbi:MAG TPA: Gfo/Idh/MocA family oxidoreductase [Candidatus Hydrogenedentes bacterium]|nr:Gfo/Idh/MocA family oxidoreductase [Candidatus Hydrogenedentota bacterium]HNT87422.1 Gfo/Idh/MocA family oxidoreductase [Candidatus Hydrogenedentota bacterium]